MKTRTPWIACLAALPLIVASCGEAPDASTGDAAAEEPVTEQPTLTDAERTKFMQWWFRNPRGIFHNKFLGISTLQNPLDVWITQEIFWEVKPDVVVECGTFHGGSAILWAVFLEQINPDAQVITIDIEDQRTERVKNLPIAKERVTFLLGSSIDPKVVEEVRRRIEGKRTIFILDSLHTQDHVYRELEAYADMVSVGSYILVQDTLDTGALAGIHDFLKERDDFVQDRSRERQILSNNIEGFLKRVR